VNQDKN